LVAVITPYVTVDAAISSNSREQLGTVVHFKRAGSDIDLTKANTIPAVAWSPPTVTALVQARQGTVTVQVALVDSLPSSPPPTGYRVTGITISPQLITLTGAPDVVAGIQSLILPPVSLSAYTSSHTFNLKIPVPDPNVRLSASNAQVTYMIAQNPAVSSSP
jgi:YbbR domain-containing protein